MKANRRRWRVMRSALLVAALAVWPALIAGAGAQERQPDYAAAPGPYDVEALEPLQVHDAARNRDVLTEIYLPAGPGPFPAIVFSHGFGGDYSVFENTSRFWASHGFVVIHPTHADSFRHGLLDGEAREIMRRYARALRRGREMDAETRRAFLALLDDPAHIEGRAADAALMLRALGEPGLISEDVRRRIDPAHVGLAGHSYGAYTTLVLAGAQLMRDGRMVSLANPRFSAFIAISGQGPGRMSLTDDSFGAISAPLMAVTATHDYGADGETPDWRLSAYRASAPGRKYAVMIDGLTHRDFDGALGDGASDVLKVLGLGFWDAYLRDGAVGAGLLAASVTDSPEGAHVSGR